MLLIHWLALYLNSLVRVPRRVLVALATFAYYVSWFTRDYTRIELVQLIPQRSTAKQTLIICYHDFSFHVSSFSFLQKKLQWHKSNGQRTNQAYDNTISCTISLSHQSTFQLSFTLLVCYRSTNQYYKRNFRRNIPPIFMLDCRPTLLTQNRSLTA